VVVPDTLSDDLRRRVAAVVQEQSPVWGMKVLHEETGLTLVQSKALALHLARRPGHCQRCDGPIPESEVAHCAHCGSLTITW